MEWLGLPLGARPTAGCRCQRARISYFHAFTGGLDAPFAESRDPPSPAQRAMNVLGTIAVRGSGVILALSTMAFLGGLHAPWTTPARFAWGAL